ncbi:Protein TIFY 5A [Vitis vinifera]|uniref:Protein TIFY n=1 Tax=Vitis vinifera TaxID=29760 RepID=A0A438DHH8_VITVI|nr:Protein TIFY 5A [Vitis vinifera]
MEFTPNLRKPNNFPSALQESIKMESNKPMNLELPLFPSTAHTSSIPTIRGGGGSPQEQQQRQQLTIFYNGRICVSDVTELRARAIILAASREMEERKRAPLSPSMQSQLCGPSGVSMKRSLHRFLQKRKNRREAMSPYNH